ncbi:MULTISPECIES: SDR family oxidoreductase [unclassified Mesorhizobium]|uniref:SDR family oxidoreductase n=1 Tax=unclassified Mesorhizobium TaxID=325217 RepID=UPI000F7501BA|nr:MULTISPECIES: SDR family oxidoreductase [unclassified Mesorhizobium]TGT61572.1 SDR family oxidoreductase [Mesorhizobium sp. M00.F.Ca.ET.170.01.1.1]AZO08992.1 SDR family oxidoreductase [Mesorhizobium sp. M3A.F.Ca.ET.080.04.2.1]RWB68220.1 MAG: SDR family oxidoreductase [Mesorhizobium sp.]RWB84536.1 MAG: SDR family oxidoreductase [Mesorhizobium sp.]RWE19614.1 MAG: SDR family oxidoreductase [Mesorhizobium sp.]
MTIANKIVAITGAGRGIGRATAIHLAARGARLALGARSEAEIAAVAGEIEAAGGEAIYRATDVTKRDDLDALVGFACKRFGRLDVIVNNAGIGPLSRFDALEVDAWDAMIDVNLKGALYGIAAALPVFSRQDSGHVINVISTAGIKIMPTMGVYAATKNALRTATEALRQESGPHLRVTEVSPGFIDTTFADDTIGNADIKAAIQKRKQELAISPEAIARAIAFAIEQPGDVEIGSIVVRPTAQD